MGLPLLNKSGAANVEFERGRIYPITDRVDIHQKRYETESMNSKVVTNGVVRSLRRVNLEGIQTGNFQEILSFMGDASVNWGENQFTFQDEDGATYSVTLWQDNFLGEEIQPNRYRVVFDLKQFKDVADDITPIGYDLIPPKDSDDYYDDIDLEGGISGIP